MLVSAWGVSLARFGGECDIGILSETKTGLDDVVSNEGVPVYPVKKALVITSETLFGKLRDELEAVSINRMAEWPTVRQLLLEA